MSMAYGTLKYQYQKWEYLSILFIFTYIPLFGYLTGELLIRIYHSRVKRNPEFLYEILPYDWMWYVIGCFLTVSCLPILMKITYKNIFRIDYEEYLMFTNLKHGYDGMKAMRPVFALFVFCAGSSIILLYDHSIKVNNNRIEFNDFLSLEPTGEKISDIEAIYHVKNDPNQSRDVVPYHLVNFRNGRQWNTGKDLRDKENEHKMIEFLSKRSKIKIDTLDIRQN
jgi:hypothetical protein